MTANTSCSSCGANITPADRFCGVCGADLSALAQPTAAPTAAKPAPVANKTMLGLPVQQGVAASTARAPKAVPQRTMLGMASPLLGAPATKPDNTDARQKQAAQGAAPNPAPASMPKQTLLGVTPIAAPAAAASAVSAPVAPSAPAPEGRKQTRFGGEDQDGDDYARPAAARPAHKAKLPAQSDRTMLGISAPVAPSVSNEALSVADTVEQSAAEVAAARAQVTRQRSFTPVPDQDQGSLRPVQAPALRWLWLAVGALTVLAIGGGVLAWLSTREAPLRVRVVTLGGLEQLEVEVPGSAAGKVRFLGMEQPLQAGRARFPLKSDALTIGDNRLALDLIGAGGAIEPSSVTLKVAYRARLDTGKLAATQPTLEVVVDAIPGSKVLLDATPLALNDHGHAVRAYPVLPQAGALLAFSASYRVEPPGERAEDGKLELSLPVASMQIDRPGPEVVTDQTLLEVAGAVEPGAQVSIDGQAVEVIDGRFLYRAQLGNPGEHLLKVVARAKGKAPRVAEIKVQRVEDLTLAAASFVPDASLSYARIAQKPVIYRGQKVAFDGRVYNVEVDAGKSVLQMLVLDCPAQSRCPLWVEYPQATEATIDSWVRVLGVIAGEQQFRSKQGQVQTVPSVHAQYVLKLAKK